MESKAARRYKREVLILGLVSTYGLTYIGLKLPSVWLNIFLIISSWTVSDYLVDVFLIKRRGIVHVPIVGWTITRRSWAYVAYLIGIVAGSTGGDILSKIFLALLAVLAQRATDAHIAFLAIGSIAIFVLVFLDLRFRTYGQRKQKGKAEKATQVQQYENSTSK